MLKRARCENGAKYEITFNSGAGINVCVEHLVEQVRSGEGVVVKAEYIMPECSVPNCHQPARFKFLVKDNILGVAAHMYCTNDASEKLAQYSAKVIQIINMLPPE